jgi:DNA-binding NarL/FixJ family response regulator
MIPVGLTHREEQVIHLLADGLADKAIADRLGVSLNTARTHVRNIIEAFNANSARHAVCLWLRQQTEEVALQARERNDE